MRDFFRWWPWGPSAKGPSILVIDDFVPDPTIGAGAPRMRALLRGLHAAGASVAFWPAESISLDRCAPKEVPGTVIVRDRSGRLDRFLVRRRGAFDAIMVSRPHNMTTLRAMMAQKPGLTDGAMLIYDAEAIFAARDIRRATLLGKPFPPEEAQRRIEEEMSLCDAADAVVAVDASTAQTFVAAGYSDVRVIGHAVDLQPSGRRFADRDGFLFVGPTYADETPNTDSVAWFADHVLPLVRRGLGRDVSLDLAGHARAPKIAARKKAGALRVAGVVADLTEFYARARVFVAPTRFAAGIPLKVFEAAARGLPIVLTPLLADTIAWTHEREVLVAETPEAFAAACVRLHGDAKLWETLRSNALARVGQDCGRADFDRNVARLVETVARRRAALPR